MIRVKIDFFLYLYHNMQEFIEILDSIGLYKEIARIIYSYKYGYSRMLYTKNIRHTQLIKHKNNTLLVMKIQYLRGIQYKLYLVKLGELYEINESKTNERFEYNRLFECDRIFEYNDQLYICINRGISLIKIDYSKMRYYIKKYKDYKYTLQVKDGHIFVIDGSNIHINTYAKFIKTYILDKLPVHKSEEPSDELYVRDNPNKIYYYSIYNNNYLFLKNGKFYWYRSNYPNKNRLIKIRDTYYIEPCQSKTIEPCQSKTIELGDQLFPYIQDINITTPTIHKITNDIVIVRYKDLARSKRKTRIISEVLYLYY